MDLKPGDKFGDRYQLLSKLGAGGMGEVWKARDTELDRDVALKVSKEEFTARFKQEARAMAAFSHPNICQIYDVGPNYIVMEPIDGAQLSGPLPVDKAVLYAGQILDALDAAHRKKFTHRDLKPANVMVMKQGGLKLLDFGLAKQQPSELGPEDETRSALTKHGQIAGTLQYMSPEQLQVKEADARSDIFAFGCVLYEMLSGRKAFSGSTTASVIAAIMEREPEPLKTTPPLDRVIRTCLAKDPDQRFQNALDLKRDLLWAMESEPSSTAPSVAARNEGLDRGGGRDDDCRSGSGLRTLPRDPTCRSSAGPPRRRSRRGCFLARRQQPVQRRHLPRWHAAGIRLRHASEVVHPASRSTESHRASGNPGGGYAVLLPRRAVDRIHDPQQTEQDLRGRRRRGPARGHHCLHRRELGCRITKS